MFHRFGSNVIGYHTWGIQYPMTILYPSRLTPLGPPRGARFYRFGSVVMGYLNGLHMSVWYIPRQYYIRIARDGSSTAEHARVLVQIQFVPRTTTHFHTQWKRVAIL